MTMGMGFPMGMGIPWIPMGMGIGDKIGNVNGKEWETTYGNGNGHYSHGNQFPSADTTNLSPDSTNSLLFLHSNMQT